MLKLAVVVFVVLWSGSAEAIIWEFDDGTTQGWVAKENLTFGGPREFDVFPGVVEDGVWKIDVSPSITGDWSRPNVELISPIIGHDSGLFDQIWVRFRTVHHSPTVGSFWLNWTNEHNLISPGEDPDNRSKSRFELSGPTDFVYTTEWQEVEFSFVGQDEVMWDGLLRDIRLIFYLDRNEDDVVGEIEIDWIELSGVEEFLQGELPPPHVEYFRFDGAGFFAPPVFYPIAPGIGARAYGGETGILTDLDGNGDADLFASWNRGMLEKSGWTMALNDGEGILETWHTEEVGYGRIEVLAGDLTGDGKDEIVMSRLAEVTKDERGNRRISGAVTEIWSVEPDLQLEMLTEIDDRWLRDMADWVFVGGDRASGFGVFVEWGGGVHPTRAVERHRLEGHGVEVLSGDVDSDGDLDLVVLDPQLGGAHVLKSLLGGQPTAVQTPTIVRPAQYRLGDSYPNPFNPAVVIPLDLATDAARVSLSVYDVLGRRVRQLWQGPLGAGAHRFTWDGRDEEGKGVAAGVYIYKVEVEGQIEAKKTTRLP